MAVAPWIAVVLLLSVVVGSRGFYLPGVAPADFQKFEMREPQMCKIACKVTLNDKDAKDLKEKIENEYRVNM
ncbi:hypothetical protein BHE74_00025293 [Ensete ventricosum]|nr:hypothetical protein GW17_00017611 [Ensete ventricosum]RWW67277.1 hypothetical protein BHE74_00025293 [Ensete ventricosum]RZS28846.1 hypothetical protein BHM03_00062501 [Ensete ventricosum]